MSRKVVPITPNLDPRHLQPPPPLPRQESTRIPGDLVLCTFDNAWSTFEDAATLTPDGRLHLNPRLSNWLLSWYPEEEISYVDTLPWHEEVDGRRVEYVMIIPMRPERTGALGVSFFEEFEGTMEFYFAGPLCTYYPQFEGTYEVALRFPIVRRSTETHTGILLLNVTDWFPILPPGSDYR